MEVPISSLGRRLAELHENIRQLEADILRFGDNPHFASRLAALERAVTQVERQIVRGTPTSAQEAAMSKIVLAKSLGQPVDSESLPGGFDLTRWCGGAYTERRQPPQMSLKF